MPALDRRTTPRVAVDVGVTLTRSLGGPVSARTVDLGSGGMRIATARPLRVDEVLHFELALYDGQPLDGACRVMRAHPRSQYAMRFERLDPADSDLLTRFVAVALD